MQSQGSLQNNLTEIVSRVRIHLISFIHTFQLHVRSFTCCKDGVLLLWVGGSQSKMFKWHFGWKSESGLLEAFRHWGSSSSSIYFLCIEQKIYTKRWYLQSRIIRKYAIEITE